METAAVVVTDNIRDRSEAGEVFGDASRSSIYGQGAGNGLACGRCGGVQERESNSDRHHTAAVNRTAISRFTRCTVPLPTPTSAATFSMPFPASRCFLMVFSTLGDTLGRPSFLPC
jgi:hypothetical protein